MSKDHPNYDPAMVAEESARYCGCHVETLREAARRGEIAVIRGSGKHSRMKFRLSELNRWLKHQEVPARKRYQA
jgi:excisionase family DNA binding protein